MHSGTIAKFVRGDYCYEAKRATERTVVFMTSHKGEVIPGLFIVWFIGKNPMIEEYFPKPGSQTEEISNHYQGYEILYGMVKLKLGDHICCD